jgi:hypothetical protein
VGTDWFGYDQVMFQYILNTLNCSFLSLYLFLNLNDLIGRMSSDLMLYVGTFMDGLRSYSYWR